MARPDLIVVHPGAAHGIYGALANDMTAVEPPQWARIIASYCMARGAQVEIIDAEALGASPQAVADYLVKRQPRLACLAVYGHQPSASTQQMPAARAILTELRKHPGVIPTTILVGGHVAALTRRTMAEERADYACNGEGPETVWQLLNGTRYEDVPGLAWWPRRGQAAMPTSEKFDPSIAPGRECNVNPSAPLIDISELGGTDAWELLPMPRYRAHNWQCLGDPKARRPYASIHTTLGCPYRCSFCCINAPFQTNSYRMRDPAAVVAEIKLLHEFYGIDTFKITDEMFILNEAHYTAIAQGLLDAGLGGELNIWAYARVDTVEAGHLALLRAAGIQWLALGIESGSALVRDGAKKHMDDGDIRDVVAAIQASGINVIGNYIFGLPDDDLASMVATLQLAMSLKTEFANFYSAMAYPGSALYTQAIERAWTLPETWRGYSQHNDDCRPLDTKHVPAAQVLEFRDAAFEKYFTSGDYLAMIGRRFGAAAVGEIRSMTRYKLTRKLLATPAA